MRPSESIVEGVHDSLKVGNLIYIAPPSPLSLSLFLSPFPTSVIFLLCRLLAVIPAALSGQIRCLLCYVACVSKANESQRSGGGG